MSLVNIGGNPLIPVGFDYQGQAPTISVAIMDLANEAYITYGTIITDDGGSHTIDTSGSSSLQWSTNIVTFADPGTTVKVGLAAVDTTTGPPGRAANVANVITFDVSKTMVGGSGGITTNALQTHVPDAGSKTVANGDTIAFAIQMTARGGADAVQAMAFSTGGQQFARTGTTTVTGAGPTYNSSSSTANVFITFSDGHVGWFAFSDLIVTLTSNLYNSGSSPNEYGNQFTIPFPTRITGAWGLTTFTGDLDIVLYSNPDISPVAQGTISVDANVVSGTGIRVWSVVFPTAYTVAAGEKVAIIIKPTTVTDITQITKQVGSVARQITEHFGTNGFAVSRSGGTGAFAPINSGQDRAYVGITLGAFESGSSSTVGMVGMGYPAGFRATRAVGY